MSFKIVVTETRMRETEVGQKWEVTGEKRQDGHLVYAYTPSLKAERPETFETFSCQLDELDIKRLMEFIAKGY